MASGPRRSSRARTVGKTDLGRPQRGRGVTELTALRAYLLETLEITLDLLDTPPNEDACTSLAWPCARGLRGEEINAGPGSGGVARAGLPAEWPRAHRSCVPTPRGRGWKEADRPGSGAGRARWPAGVQIDAQRWRAPYVEFSTTRLRPPGAVAPEGGRGAREAGRDAGRPELRDQIGVGERSGAQTMFGSTAMSGSQPSSARDLGEADAWARWADRACDRRGWEIAATHAARKGFAGGRRNGLRDPAAVPGSSRPHGPAHANWIRRRVRPRAGAARRIIRVARPHEASKERGGRCRAG